MNDRFRAIFLITCTALLMIGIALVALGAMMLGSSEPTSGIGTALSVSRGLRCEEDEDIVVTLGANGLPFAYCFQVIER